MIKRTKVTILFFALMAFVRPLLPCDMSAFVQSEFSERCQRLINYCEKAYVALSVAHPDTENRLNLVSNDWVEFYLSHGNSKVQPPNMAMVAPEVWDSSLKALGNNFYKFLKKQISPDEYHKLILQVSVFKNEEQLKELHKAFKTSQDCEQHITKVTNIEEWEKERLTPYVLIYNYVEAYPELVAQINDSCERFKAELFKVNNTNELESKQQLFNQLNNSISKDLSTWHRVFLFE